MIDHIAYKDKDTTQQLTALADSNDLEPGQFYFATNTNRSYYAATDNTLIGPLLGTDGAFYHISLLDDDYGLEDLWTGENKPNPYFLQEVTTDITVTVNNDAPNLWSIGQVITFRQFNTGKLNLTTSGTQSIQGPIQTNDTGDVLHLMRVDENKWVSWLVRANESGGGIELTSEITAATTLTAGHANKYIPVNSATPIDITIDGSVFAENDQIVLEQTGNGIITVVQGTGMTLNGDLNSMGQYKVLVIFFKSATVATVIGGEA